MEYFERFPGAELRRQVRKEDDPFGEAAYRSWFILIDGIARLAFEDNGTCWTDDGDQIMLLAHYQQTHHVWDVAHRVGRTMLP